MTPEDREDEVLEHELAKADWCEECDMPIGQGWCDGCNAVAACDMFDTEIESED